jgi:hypothetical protein
MDALSYPTIVFCVEQIGLEVARSLAEMLRNASSVQPASVWAISTDKGLFAVSSVGRRDDPAPRKDCTVGADSIANAIQDVVAEVLSLGESRVPGVMDRPIGLRLALVGAAWEVTPAMASELARAFHAAARPHLGSRYLVEACLLLPNFLPHSFQTAGILQEWSNVLEASEGCPEGAVLDDLFNYCWWFGRINASGLALPSLPTSIADIATVIYGVTTVPPERLPSTVTILAAPPQHMSAGYAELLVPREQVVDYLVARNACSIIDRSFLDRAGSIDHAGIRRRAWAFTSSSDCAEALKRIDLTPGGERVWPGFHPTVPDQIVDGEIDEFLSSVHEAMDRFKSAGLKQVRAAIELSGRSCREKLLAAIEAQVREIADCSRGGLFESQAFLEEMTAFVLETTDVSEGEVATNLQQVRRTFDHAFAEQLALKRPSHSKEHESRAEELRKEIAQLTRLRNISAPPALTASVCNDLRWGEEERWTSFNQRISEATQQLQQEMALWAEELATAERWFQHARYETQPEQDRREQNISECEEALRQTASECRRLLVELAKVPRRSPWLWFLSSHKKRALREKNERLAYLRAVLLRQQAREVVAAYAARIQLSIDRALYEVRDRIIHDALSHVRNLHEKTSQAIKALGDMRAMFASIQPPTLTQVLRRELLTREDLDEVFYHLRQGPAAPETMKSLSGWNVCCQHPVTTENQVRDVAMRPFTALRGWVMEEFLQLLKPSNARLEALIGWLKQASQPLVPPTGEETSDYSLIRSEENSQFGELLHHSFPEATWDDRPTAPTTAVLQVRQLSKASVANCLKQAAGISATDDGGAASSGVGLGTA